MGRNLGRKSNKGEFCRPFGQRALAMLLTLVMIFALCVVSVQAEDDPAVDDAVATSDVEAVVTSNAPDASELDTTPVEGENEGESGGENESEPAAISEGDEVEDEEPAKNSETIQSVENDQAETVMAIEPVDLKNYLNSNTNLVITVTIDGTKYQYTPEELTTKGIAVPKGAPVKVQLYFDTIYNVQKGQTLEYQFPDGLLDYSGANSAGIVWSGVVWEENNSGAYVEAADWAVDNTGKLTVTLRDDFFEENKHTSDNTIDLFKFNVNISGSFSDERGEHSGHDDDIISFRGSTAGTGGISFKIPFEYRNENSIVDVEKEISKFDEATRTATYTIKVTAPTSNTYTSANVVVTDVLDSDLVEALSNGDIYRNAQVDAGSFDAKTGVWTIGDMVPGDEHTLTYDIVISSAAYKNAGSFNNKVTVAYNEDGQNETEAILKLPGTVVVDKTMNTNGNSSIMTDDGGSYISYTLTATACGSDMSNVVVKDAFGDATLISKIAVVGDVAQGTVTIDNDTASLKWVVGNIKDGKSVTLTYKAYLNTERWKDSGKVTVDRTVKNTVAVYVGDPDSTTDEPLEPYDTVTRSISLRKTWLTKAGAKVTDSSSKNGLYKYVLKVNDQPVDGSIKTIYDVLTGGTYEDGGSIELTAYKYNADGTKTQVTGTPVNIPLSEVVTTTADGQRFDIDLASRGLSGSYYYELVYYVASGASVTIDNKAGVRFGVGTDITAAASIQGSGGMTYGTDYKKNVVTSSETNSLGINYKEGYAKWQATVYKTIEKGSVFNDYIDPAAAQYYEQNMLSRELFWFSYDNFGAYNAETNPYGILIKLGDEIIYPGDDTYTVTGTSGGTTYTGDAAKTAHYTLMQVTFNEKFEATSTEPLTITYYFTINNQAKDYTGTRNTCADSYYYKNRCWWNLPVNGVVSNAHYGDTTLYNDSSKLCYSNKPLKKCSGVYENGTIYWNIEINRQTSIEGDAVLEEYIPAGLTFDRVEQSYTGVQATGTTWEVVSADGEEATNSKGEKCTKITIKIKDLVAWKTTSNGDTTSYSTAGQITLRIYTKVDSDVLLNLNTTNVSFYNEAILTGDSDLLPENGVKATGTAVISTTTTGEQITKSQAKKENPAYIEYALNINPSSLDFDAESDTLEIVDVMNTGMSFTSDTSHLFKVYDITNVANAVDSNGKVDVSVAATNGEDVTSQCKIEDITGQKLNGMTEDEVGKPAYLITVPDGKHLAVIYWATFEGAAGDEVAASNTASFFYNGMVWSGGQSVVSGAVTASDGDATMFTGPYFYLKKTDQWGNLVAGVKYTLYKVTLNADGTEATKTEVMSKTTVASETLYFGHRTTDANSVPELTKDTLYCLVETGAPAGYTIDSTPYYFEFKTAGQSAVTSPTGTTLHQFVVGGTYTFTNQFEGVSFEVPVNKTINGKNLASRLEFSFNLKQTAGEPVYVNDTYNEALPEDGIDATITGSGKTLFDALYFRETGEYTFELTEKDLSQEAEENGYSKDSKVYTVKIIVGAKDAADGVSKKLVISSATYALKGSSDSSSLLTSAPTFNNTSSLSGQFTMTLKKEVTGRNKEVAEGEFGVTVSVGGTVIAEKNADGSTKIGSDGKPVKKVFYTKAGGDIDITIDIDQDDIGVQTYVISEVAGEDENIEYTDEKIKVRVTIAEAGRGEVAATNIEYMDGEVITNKYIASGSYTLSGTKILTLAGDTTNQLLKVKNDQFEFTVMEGNTIVGTGKTKYGGEIEFTTINYIAQDIGVHTYTITEKKGGELFQNYDAGPVTVQLEVYDVDGTGKLAVRDFKVTSGLTDMYGNPQFQNTCTHNVANTGISLDLIPYLIIVLLAAGFGTLLIIRRRKRRG